MRRRTFTGSGRARAASATAGVFIEQLVNLIGGEVYLHVRDHPANLCRLPGIAFPPCPSWRHAVAGNPRLEFCVPRKTGGCVQITYAIVGCFCPKRVACSNACANCKTLKSSLMRPTICTPTGSP